jgi:hypothetical protein
MVMVALVLQAVLVSAGLLAFGYLLADAFAPRGADLWLRCGLAFPALVCFVLVVMVAHLTSGGAVFERPGLVRTVAIVSAGVLVARKLRIGGPLRRPSSEGAMLLGLVALACLVWGSPIVRMLPIGHIGDQNLHMGWASQLLNGEPSPTAALTGAIPNYYPWLFHAVVAFVACFTTGGRAFDAQPAVLLLQLSGSVLALYALGRQLTGRQITGIASALFGALAGGWGFLVVRGPDLVVDPRAEGGASAVRLLGDLLYRRSYNLALHNLAPAFPRDVAFALMPAYLLLLVVALKRRNSYLLASAACVLGLIGLTGAEAFLVGMAIAIGLSWFFAGCGRVRTGFVLVAPALLLWGLWAIPLSINYLRLGGFVNTASPLVTLSPLGIVGAWGIALPVALYGYLKQPGDLSPDAKRVIQVLLFTAVGATLVSGSLASWLGPGFTTLGRPHRYWPLVYLGVALWAALGLTSLRDRWASRPLIASVGIILIVAGALSSPLLASLALPQKLPSPWLLRASLEGDSRSPLNLLAASVGRECTVAVPERYSQVVFAYTGHRSVWFPYSTDDPTRARIRWATIYQHIASPGKRLRDNHLLLQRSFPDGRWVDIARAYGVDRLLLPLAHSNGFPSEAVTRVGPAYGQKAVVSWQKCDG